MSPRSKFKLVLLHGAGLNTDIWYRFEKICENPFLSLDFPNRGKDSYKNSGIELGQYVDHLRINLQAHANSKIIFIAHSLSGMMALKLAEIFSENTVGIIGIGAALPVSNKSFLSVLPFPSNHFTHLIIKLMGTKPPQGVIRKKLCENLYEKDCNRIIGKYSGESNRLFTDQLNYQAAPKNMGYIGLLQDKAFPLKAQQKSITNQNINYTSSINSGHLPMLSHPNLLYEEIVNIIKVFE